MAVQSDRAPAAANFVNVLFICNPPLAWPRRRRTDGSAEAGRSHSRCNYSMVTQLRQFASRPAHDRLCLGAVPSGPTRLTHGTGPSRKLSNIACRHVTMVLSNSYWNVWRCGRSDTPSHVFIPRCRQPRTAHSRPEPRVPSVKDICISKNMRIRKRNILTALAIMHRSASQKSARSSRTIPREDFLRVGERLEAAHDTLVRRHGRRH